MDMKLSIAKHLSLHLGNGLPVDLRGKTTSIKSRFHFNNITMSCQQLYKAKKFMQLIPT